MAENAEVVLAHEITHKVLERDLELGDAAVKVGEKWYQLANAGMTVSIQPGHVVVVNIKAFMTKELLAALGEAGMGDSKR